MSGRRKLVIALAVATAFAGIGFGLDSLVHYVVDADATCMNQGLTIVTREGTSGECVGITDGSYQFDPASQQLTAVENAIKAEDQKVRRQGSDYVSVAYLLPISATGGVEPIQAAAEQLEGAYTAQYYANDNNNVEGTAPLIQLLIVSGGTQAGEYGTAVRDIENDVTSQHLVGVAGIGVSLDSTIDEVNALTSRGIPVFGSTITSDAFDNITDLVRVSPSNQEEVNAALSFIKSTVKTAFLVEDTNQTDSYDTTIVNEFRSDFPDRTHQIVADESYNTAGDLGGSSPAAVAVANRIGQMTSDICLGKAGVVLFAGRGRDLATLLGDLADRPCLNQGQQVTIITGDDVTDMPITPGVGKGLGAGVALYYAGEANPGEWARGTTDTIKKGRQGFETFYGAFTRLFHGAPIVDSAMMGYDAVLTSVSAIRLAGPNPVPSSVDGELSALQGSRMVLGASGPIDLPADYIGGKGSNPVDKAIPILRLQPDGKAAFVKLEWSSR